jgi:hypothetical protein
LKINKMRVSCPQRLVLPNKEQLDSKDDGSMPKLCFKVCGYIHVAGAASDHGSHAILLKKNFGILNYYNHLYFSFLLFSCPHIVHFGITFMREI